MLLAVQTNTGKLFRINPRTGVTREVDLGEASLANGDGMLLAGRVLFVVQNRLNQIAVVKLSRSLHRGRVVATLTDPAFDVPTTIAFQAGRLYAVNAPLRHHRPPARPATTSSRSASSEPGGERGPAEPPWESGTVQKDSPFGEANREPRRRSRRT